MSTPTASLDQIPTTETEVVDGAAAPTGQKVSKEEFVTYTATHIILTRHVKPLCSAQRKKLRIKTTERAKEIVNLAVLFFCQAHFRQDPHSNVDRLVKLWRQNTKKDRMELCQKAIYLTQRHAMIEAYNDSNKGNNNTEDSLQCMASKQEGTLGQVDSLEQESSDSAQASSSADEE